MKKPAKIAIGCLIVGGLFIALLVAAFIHDAMGFDASKQDPRKLYMFYVQKQMPTTVRVLGAAGRVTPMGGMDITFKFQISQKDLDQLISSKHLRKTDSFQPDLFAAADMNAMKHPEFYETDTDTTWTASFSAVRMAVDRDSGLVIYMVFSP